MTLEAANETDKRCVLNWLYELYVTPSRAFDEYTEDELKMFAHDAIVLLKEQKHGHWIDLQNCSNAGVYCSECHVKVFPYYPMKKKLSLFCPHCGAKMDGETVKY